MNLKQLKGIIKQGEGETVEFKRGIVSDLGKEICALANREGGYLLLGVDDDGRVVGHQTNKAKDKLTAFVLSISPAPQLKFYDFLIDKKKVLVVEVKKTDELCTVGNIAYIRLGTSKRALTLQEILVKGVENLLFTVDRAPTGISAEEIDKQLLASYAQNRQKRGLSSVRASTLEKLGVIERRKNRKLLSLAGALCFLAQPQEYYPFAGLRIKTGTAWKRIEGSLFEIIESAIKILTSKSFSVSVFEGAKRQDVFFLPLRVLREAIVNALVHRNYAIESEAFIYLEKRKIRIINPGSLPPGVDINDPKPVPRNPLLYELFFQSGYVEKEGSGIQMMRQESKKLGLKMSYKIRPNFTELIFELPSTMTERELEILSLVKEKPMSAKELAGVLDISKVAVLRYINKLKQKEMLKSLKSGRYLLYSIK